MAAITGSPDITKVDFSALFDISQVTPAITCTNLCTGPNLAGCKFWFIITDPSNNSFHQGSATSPDENGNWTTFVVPEAWPQPFNNQIVWSGASYQITLWAQDSIGNTYSQLYQFAICRPSGSAAQASFNFGVAVVSAKTQCQTAQLYVEDDSLYTYQGLTPGSFAYQRYTLVYPGTDSDNIPDPYVLNGQSSALLPLLGNGDGYVLYYDTIANYAVLPNITVRIKYKFKQLFSVQCNVNLWPLVCEVSKLLTQLDSQNCLVNQDPELRDKLLKINTLLFTAMIGIIQPFNGADINAIIEEIKILGGFTCDCTLPGINGNQSSSLNFTQEVVATCGDIKANVTLNGTNFQWSFQDVTYILAANGDETTAFSFKAAVNSPLCQKTYTLYTDLDQLKSDLGVCCPQSIPVKLQGSSPLVSPTACPNSYFPANVWNATGTVRIGIAYNSSDLVAILNSDSTWNTKGTAINEGNCQIGFLLNAGQTLPPQVLVDLNVVSPACVNNTKTYDTPLVNYCSPGTPLTSLPFPARIYVQYTTGGQKYSLGLIPTYVAMITALGAEGSRPVNITYTAAPTGPMTGHVNVQVFDANCSFNNAVTIFADALQDIVVGANNNYDTQPYAGMDVFDLKSDAYIGQYPGIASTSAKPWHIKRSPFNSNHVYYIETNTGLLYKYDVSNPLFPVKLLQVTIPPVLTGAPPNAAFSGLPKYNGTVFSHYDVYLGCTEPYGQETGSTYMYIYESTSGCIWQYNVATDTITASFYDLKLVGKCPRTMVVPSSGNYTGKACIYFSWDGNRETATGLSSGIARNSIIFLDTTTFNSGGIHEVTGITGIGDEPWAISNSSDGTTLYIVTLLGGLIIYNANTNVIILPLAAIFGISFIGSVLIDSMWYFDGTNTRVYAVSDLWGTYIVDVTGVPIARGAFGANTDDSLVHRNFLPIPGNCYGLLTYDNGDQGGIAKYGYDGTFIERIIISPGTIYNLIVYGYPNSVTPNGLV